MQKKIELKESCKNVIREKLLGLSKVIQETFQFLVAKNCTDDVWARFIKVFDTGACYDGTYDYISPTGKEITSSGDGVDKRPPNKIFVEMLSNIPGSLKGILNDHSIESFVQDVDKSDNKKTFFATNTLEKYFGKARNRWDHGPSESDRIREVVGKGLNGEWRLSDQEMLELIYWSVKLPEGIFPDGGTEGPIYKLFMGN